MLCQKSNANHSENSIFAKTNKNKMSKHTNKLINEQSPYLLQHAHNPVEWYPWGMEALQRAVEEDKPILISIGYAACHWCHVMERESFEDETVAAFMNEHFINIKVDREERPDLDHIYMEAIMAINGSGGWPLNCFLTPKGLPFYGGTYFPPKQMHGRASWLQILENIAKAYKTRKKEVEQQAQHLTYTILQQDKSFFKSKVLDLDTEQPFEASQIDNIFEAIEKRFDTEDGGFGAAPKFPQTMTLDFLLNYFSETKEKKALEHAVFSLDKMTKGGIYDHLAGGFSRYTVDKAWLVPHFEKMLYDNALLVSVLAKAYRATKDKNYKQVIEQTLAFVEREMMSEEGGFYASYDADSEGEEGKFYVWQKSEIDRTLQHEAAVFNRFYGVTEEGNWEGKNILNRQLEYADFAEKIGYETEELQRNMRLCRKRLWERREMRVPPALDDKIILSWNAMMCTAFCEAYKSLGNESYKMMAERNLYFMLEKFNTKENDAALHHTYKNGKAQHFAFLDDYALLIEAILQYYSVSFDEKMLTLADKFTDYVMANFLAADQTLFYYTSVNQRDIVGRKKEYYDSATPSGNSTMAKNLQTLGILLHNEKYVEQAMYMSKAIEDSLVKYASSFSRWANVALHFAFPTSEIVIVGENAFELAKEINALFLPNKIVIASKTANEESEWLQNRFVAGKTFIYVCQKQACYMPVETVEEMQELLAKIKG